MEAVATVNNRRNPSPRGNKRRVIEQISMITNRVRGIGGRRWPGLAAPPSGALKSRHGKKGIIIYSGGHGEKRVEAERTLSAHLSVSTLSGSLFISLKAGFAPLSFAILSISATTNNDNKEQQQLSIMWRPAQTRAVTGTNDVGTASHHSYSLLPTSFLLIVAFPVIVSRLLYQTDVVSDPS